MAIAAMGASGHVGGELARLLIERNQRVRVLAHKRHLDPLRAQGADIVAGDAGSGDDLGRLFDGVDAAFVLLPENPADPDFAATRSRQSEVIARALRDARVGHVVALSTVGVDKPGVAGPPVGLREFEQRLTDLVDGNLLVLRSATYMDYLLANLPLVESQRVNGSAVRGDVPIPLVATRDVAREAAERLIERDFAGRQVSVILGPEDLTMGDVTAAIGRRLGMADLPYVEFPPDGVRDALRAAGFSDQMAGLLVEMQLALNGGWPYAGLDRSAATTGTTTFEAFLDSALPARARAGVS